MTDFTPPPSARRFALFLKREHCVWMGSPSLALLSALVSAARPPTHLLLQDGAPSFASNTGRLIGALPIDVPLAGLEEALQVLLAGEEVSPEQVWGVTTHRPGTIPHVDWHSICESKGVPTVDLCLGGVKGLAERRISPSTFTIVDLDEDPAFEGLRLTALLTDSSARAERVRAMCLPGPGNQDYALDAAPRGVDADEARLAGIMEATLPQFEGGEAPPRTSKLSGFGLAAVESDHETAVAKAKAEKDALAARLAEVEGDRKTEFAQALQQEVMHRSALREERRRAANLEGELANLTSRAAAQASAWEVARAAFLERIARFSAQAVLAETAQAALQAEKADAERSIALLETEGESLSEKLAQVERDRDEAMADAARRDLTNRFQKKKWTVADKKRLGALDEADMWFKAQAASLARAEERAAGLQKELAANAERHASQGREWQSEKAEMSERLGRLEAARSSAEDSRLDAVSRNEEALQALAALQTRSDGLALKLTEAESARDAALAEAAKRQGAHHAAQDEQRRQEQELRDQLAMAAARQAQQLREWDSSRSDLVDRIARLETAAVFAENAHTDLLAQRTQIEQSLESVRNEREALVEKLAEVEAERNRLAAEAAERDEAQEMPIAEDKERAEKETVRSQGKGITEGA